MSWDFRKLYLPLLQEKFTSKFKMAKSDGDHKRVQVVVVPHLEHDHRYRDPPVD